MMKFRKNQWVFDKVSKSKAKIKKFENGDIVVTIKSNDQIIEVTRKPNELTYYKNKKRIKRDVILFAKLKPDAIIPTKRYEDGCYDIYANFDDNELHIEPHQIVHIPTGIASSFKPKYRINCKRERGSTGKIGLEILSGQIDSGYRGEWFITVLNPTNKKIVISKKVNEIVFDEENKTVYYPYSKAICQAAVEFVPDVRIKEIPYEKLEKIPSLRGKGKLGQSGK